MQDVNNEPDKINISFDLVRFNTKCKSFVHVQKTHEVSWQLCIEGNADDDILQQGL